VRGDQETRFSQILLDSSSSAGHATKELSIFRTVLDTRRGSRGFPGQAATASEAPQAGSPSVLRRTGSRSRLHPAAAASAAGNQDPTARPANRQLQPSIRADSEHPTVRPAPAEGSFGDRDTHSPLLPLRGSDLSARMFLRAGASDDQQTGPGCRISLRSYFHAAPVLRSSARSAIITYREVTDEQESAHAHS
jgi:hypothetical protein